MVACSVELLVAVKVGELAIQSGFPLALMLDRKLEIQLAEVRDAQSADKLEFLSVDLSLTSAIAIINVCTVPCRLSGRLLRRLKSWTNCRIL